MSLLLLLMEDSQFNLIKIWARVQTVPPNLFMIHPLSSRMILITNLKKCPIIHLVARKRRKRRRRSVGTASYRIQSCMSWWNLMERYSLFLKKARLWKKKKEAVVVIYSSSRVLEALILGIIWLMWRWHQITQSNRRRRYSLRRKRNFLNMKRSRQKLSLHRYHDMNNCLIWLSLSHFSTRSTFKRILISSCIVWSGPSITWLISDLSKIDRIYTL